MIPKLYFTQNVTYSLFCGNASYFLQTQHPLIRRNFNQIFYIHGMKISPCSSHLYYNCSSELCSLLKSLFLYTFISSSPISILLFPLSLQCSLLLFHPLLNCLFSNQETGYTLSGHNKTFGRALRGKMQGGWNKLKTII